MESDFSDIIVSLLRQAEPDLESRLDYQSEALRERKCTDPLIGRWIDTNHVQYLLAAFALNDGDFVENFPKMAHVTEHHRQQIINKFQHHISHCPHCSLKQGFDLEFDSRIERAFRDNKEQLLHELNSGQVAEHLELDGVVD